MQFARHSSHSSHRSHSSHSSHQSGQHSSHYSGNHYSHYSASCAGCELIPDEVYKQKPLYSFVLNKTNLDAIREYNSKHKYSDFTLNCTLEDVNTHTKNSACKMSQEFRNLLGNIDGVCSSLEQTGTSFYKCVYER